MRRQRAARLRVGGLAACGIVLVQLVTFEGCVDGTTPDCSDAATHCGPEVDAAPDVLDATAALPESAPPADAPNDTSSSADANGGGDADLDAGDGG
jgi:hypothetical protein